MKLLTIDEHYWLTPPDLYASLWRARALALTPPTIFLIPGRWLRIGSGAAETAEQGGK